MADLLHDRLVPKWLRDLVRLLSIRAQFMLTGNIDDVFLAPTKDGYTFKALYELLWNALSGIGFRLLVRVDPVLGVRLYPTNADAAVVKALDIRSADPPLRLDDLMGLLRRITNDREHRVVALIEHASRLPLRADNLSVSEHQFFAACDQLARDAYPVCIKQDEKASRCLYNPIVWTATRRNDLPPWFGLNNQKLVAWEIEKPSQDQRYQAASLLLSKFAGSNHVTEEQGTRYARLFADMADGMTLLDMWDIARLAQENGLDLSDVDDAVRNYKTGDPTLDNPWRSTVLQQKLLKAEVAIRNRLKGQDQAIELAMDILKRSVLGLTGAHASSSHGRPRGILFLAGPTGVGKTELAKTLADTIFGGEQSMIRFDMSEFSAEHADQRLIGAPPSYVGYESGGELTNAIRARPFSLVLFDEIDKANQRILDKFLQILEDGRLTDGRGETVYFSECILVFTTNLGIVGRDAQGNPKLLVDPSKNYDEVRDTVLEAIKKEFQRIQRPELLNRLGNNIVVFNFISPQAAQEIFDILLDNIRQRFFDEYRASLILDDAVLQNLRTECTKNLEMGGRGIGNCLETRLINPLSRALFPHLGQLRTEQQKTVRVASLEEKVHEVYGTVSYVATVYVE